MIPVLGTAVVNDPFWLYRMFMSIDYPVQDFVVFNNNGRGEITKEVDMLRDIPNKFIKNIHICHLPGNVGCSGAWNLIIKSFLTSPYWIISNPDVMFTPGFLEEMVSRSSDEEIGMVHGNDEGWDLFLIKDWVVNKYGLFDENTYPAYCEDDDYKIRFAHRELKRILSLNTPYYHGMSLDTTRGGGCTRKADPIMHERIHQTHEINQKYLMAKWGVSFMSGIIDERCNKHPFNNENYDVSFTSYNLELNRKKYLGF
jgi:hypothetical protein